MPLSGDTWHTFGLVAFIPGETLVCPSAHSFYEASWLTSPRSETSSTYNLSKVSGTLRLQMEYLLTVKKNAMAMRVGKMRKGAFLKEI